MEIYGAIDANGWDFLNPVESTDFRYLNAVLDGKVTVDEWVPLAVRREERIDSRSPELRVSDSPWFHGGCLVLTETARERSDSLLGSAGMYRPLDCQGEVLYFYLPTVVIPALSVEESTVEYFRSSGRLSNIRRYVFRREVIGDHQIFRIPERLRTELFVTEGFRQAWLDTGITGVDFELVWSDDPADPGPFYDELRFVK